MIWQDTRNLWYARVLRPFGQEQGRRFGPYGDRDTASKVLNREQEQS